MVHTTAIGAVHWDRIWRRKYLVLLITVIVGLGGAISAASASATYSSKSTLTVLSQSRAPEQDAILAQGYVSFFNDPGYQVQLRQIARISPDITLAAGTSGPSQLITITATSTSPDGVETASRAMATALQNTINDAVRAGQDSTIDAIRKPYNDIRSSGGVIPEQALIQLEDRINQINGDSTNKIETIDLASEVTTGGSNRATTILLALVAGLVLGCGVALLAGTFARRVQSLFDLSKLTDLDVLGVVRPRATRAAQTTMWSQVAVAVDHRTGPQSPTVAVFDTATGSTSALDTAIGLAQTWSSSGYRTVILDAGAPAADPKLYGEPGAETDELIATTLRTATASPQPYVAVGTDAPMLRRNRLITLFEAARAQCDRVIVVVPPVAEYPGAELIGSVADIAVLVVDQDSTRIREFTSTLTQLQGVDAAVAGSVWFDHPPRRLSRRTVRTDALALREDAEAMARLRTTGAIGAPETSLSDAH